MRAKSVIIAVMAIAAGSALIYATYSINQGISDTGSPLSPMGVLGSPTFIIPAITIAACVLAAISIMAWRDKVSTGRPLHATGNEDLTGFRVGKKSTSGTRLADVTTRPVDDISRDQLEGMTARSTTNDQPTGFRVGKKTIGSTRLREMEGPMSSDTMDRTASTSTPAGSASTGGGDPTGFRVGKKTTSGTKLAGDAGGSGSPDEKIDAVKPSTTNEELTGFRVGRKTTGST